MAQFLYVDGIYSINIHGNMVIVDEDHPNYVEIANKISTATEEELEILTNVKKAREVYVAKSGDGRATVEDGVVMFDGEPVHNVISNRIQDHMKANVPFDNLLRFLENIEENPSSTSREELYDFLENTGLPITEDGCFLAWKGVGEDFMDKWSGKYNNTPGQSPKMPRRDVDDNRDRSCSYGLHVGAPQYAKDYAGYNNGKVVLVKVNPKDAVSVPKDCSCQKLRCCTYEVLREVERDYSLENVAVCNEDGTVVLDQKANEVLDEDRFRCAHNVEVGRAFAQQWYPLPSEVESFTMTTTDETKLVGHIVDCWPFDAEGNVIPDCATPEDTCGIKPEGGSQAGRRYHNRRDESGKFTKKEICPRVFT